MQALSPNQPILPPLHSYFLNSTQLGTHADVAQLESFSKPEQIEDAQHLANPHTGALLEGLNTLPMDALLRDIQSLGKELGEYNTILYTAPKHAHLSYIRKEVLSDEASRLKAELEELAKSESCESLLKSTQAILSKQQAIDYETIRQMIHREILPELQKILERLLDILTRVHPFKDDSIGIRISHTNLIVHNRMILCIAQKGGWTDLVKTCARLDLAPIQEMLKKLQSLNSAHPAGLAVKIDEDLNNNFVQNFETRLSNSFWEGHYNANETDCARLAIACGLPDLVEACWTSKHTGRTDLTPDQLAVNGLKTTLKSIDTNPYDQEKANQDYHALMGYISQLACTKNSLLNCTVHALYNRASWEASRETLFGKQEGTERSMALRLLKALIDQSAPKPQLGFL
jgi:hypothetical protein